MCCNSLLGQILKAIDRLHLRTSDWLFPRGFFYPSHVTTFKVIVVQIRCVPTPSVHFWDGEDNCGHPSGNESVRVMQTGVGYGRPKQIGN